MGRVCEGAGERGGVTWRDLRDVIVIALSVPALFFLWDFVASGIAR